MDSPASVDGGASRTTGGPDVHPQTDPEMDPNTQSAERPAARRGRAAWRFCRGGMLLAGRLALSLSAIALLVAAVLYLRLLQGPLVLPGLAELASARINSATDRFQVAAGDAVLTLGERGVASGLQFRDVELRSADGQRLFSAPRLAGRFYLADLLQGRIRPVRITLLEPDLQIIRSPEGGFRFGLGRERGVALGGAEGAGEVAGGGTAGGPPDSDAASRVIDSLAGDGAPIPFLAKLDEIAIIGANVVYDDRLGDGDWQTDHATVRLVRSERGLRATMDIDTGVAGVPGATVRAVADRARGAGRTELTVRFGRLAASDLARQSRQLDWLALIGGTVEGEVGATLAGDGRLDRLEGVVVAEGGQIRGLGQPIPFDMAQLRFRTDLERERLMIDDFRLSAAAGAASLHGFADLRRGEDGELHGLAGQFDIGALYLDLPDIFADPLDFDGGRLTARWSLDEERVEVVGGRLARGDLAFTVEGGARATNEGWVTDLRAEAEGMTVDHLVAFWPLAAARNARTWIDENIPVGRIDQLTAQMRLGRGDPQIALDFAYSGTSAEYVEGMSPIVEASGTGHVTFNDLFLSMHAGQVAPIAEPDLEAGQRIDLGGSSLVISGFWGDVTPANIALKAEGSTEAVLALLDQPPLGLISRLGRDLGQVGGRARVEADMVVPLLKRLKVADVEVTALATLSDVAMPFQLDPRRTVEVRAERLELAADTERLELAGDAVVDGIPLAIAWREAYGGGASGRELDLAGRATPELLAAAGATDLPMEGAPRFDLTLRQSGGGAMRFELDADLEPVRLEVGALDWVKEKGIPARLRAEGTQGDGLDISALHLESAGLEAEGAVKLTADGALGRAEFNRIRMPGLGDLAATAAPGRDGVLDLRLTGRRLDLSERIGEAGAGATGGGAAGGDAARPVRLSFDLAELRLSEKVALKPASGRVVQGASGALSGRIEGSLGPRAPLVVNLDIPGSGPGQVTVTSPNAGEALHAAGFYSGAEGGSLSATVRTGTPEKPGLTGQARIEDVVVHSQSTFREVLRDGGLPDAEAEVSSGGGMRFRKVWVPFTYQDDRLTLTDAIAVSPALAIKLNGIVDEATDRVDLVGVLSPAYVLTGALNEVPLIGQILGGRGEGILAMTFRLRGDIRDPRFTVNPLSVLAPGFLRRIFTHQAAEADEEFRERISRQGR